MAASNAVSKATRKPHHKSKLGCGGCKKKRIKCDEDRPACQNCTKRGLVCDFLTISSTDRSQMLFSTLLDTKGLSRVLVLSGPKTNSEKPYPSPPPPLLLDTLLQHGLLQDAPENQQSQLKQLLHHFITATSVTLTHNSAAQAVWPAAIPQLATRHQFVLDGVLAMASLHLSRCVGSETERRIHFNIANSQLNKGLAQYRTEIQRITEINAEALFSFSTLTSIWVSATIGDECKALLSSITQEGLSPNSRQAAIRGLTFATTRILRCLRGVLLILIPYWHRIEGGVFGPLANKQWWPNPIPTTPEAIEEDGRIRALETLWMKPGRSYEYYLDTLRSALKNLRECFAQVSQLTTHSICAKDGTHTATLLDWTSVIAWIIQVPAEFTSLLEQQIPEAWVILAHYAILVAKAKGIWWLDTMPSNLVSTAALILGETKWDLIDWPARCVGLDLESLRVNTAEHDCDPNTSFL